MRRDERLGCGGRAREGRGLENEMNRLWAVGCPVARINKVAFVESDPGLSQRTIPAGTAAQFLVFQEDTLNSGSALDRCEIQHRPCRRS